MACDSALLVVSASSWRGEQNRGLGWGFFPELDGGLRAASPTRPERASDVGKEGKRAEKHFWISLGEGLIVSALFFSLSLSPSLSCARGALFICLKNYSPITSNITDFVGVSRPNISDGTEHTPWELTSWIALSEPWNTLVAEQHGQCSRRMGEANRVIYVLRGRYNHVCTI